MYRNKKGEFQSKADKKLKQKIALAQARQVWQWSVCIIILGTFPVLEIKDRLNKEYVFENPSAAVAQVGNQAQDEAHAESEEAQMEDGTSRGKHATVSVSENQRGNEHTHLPSSLSDIEAKIQKAIVTTYNAEVAQTDSDPFTMASGKRVYEGAIASNCHKIGTKIQIRDLGEFVVEDRMNSRYTKDCGTESERLDIFKWNRADNFKKVAEYAISEAEYNKEVSSL